MLMFSWKKSWKRGKLRVAMSYYVKHCPRQNSFANRKTDTDQYGVVSSIIKYAFMVFHSSTHMSSKESFIFHHLLRDLSFVACGSAGRIKDLVARAGIRPLDDAQRSRAKRKQLDALERDNHDDQFDAVEAAVAQDIEEEEFVAAADKKKKKKHATAARTGSKTAPRSLDQFLAEHGISADSHASGVPTYFSAAAAPSIFPARKFCSVCGNFSKYACMRCGQRVCGTRCDNTHHETRCK
jgi:zinc finger HIT domain-containing protein 1